MILNRIVLVLLLAAPFAAFSQITEPGRPLALENPALQQNLPAPVVLPAINAEEALKEDTRNQGQTRFAAPIAADISPENASKWTDLPDGGRVWHCVVQSDKAVALVLFFDHFKVPPGARFFASSANYSTVSGAFTEKSNQPGQKLLIGPVMGEQTILEYYEPAGYKNQGNIHINRVDYAYDRYALAQGQVAGLLGFGSGLPCNVNVNCSAGNDWQTEKKGIARILIVFDNGSGWCTGSMIANTAGTYEPYFLSAHHCQIIGTNPHFDMWRFDFDYEASGCSNPGVEPQYKSVLGCQRISYRAETDFMLLKLNPVPVTYGVYFNGWNRGTTPATKSVYIHHPVGDIKKISVDTAAATLYAQSINWGGAFGISQPNTHWSVKPDIGIYQGGSSGCPQFDQNKRIVGQLHGGIADNNNECIIYNSFFGRFDLSWNQGTSSTTRLKDWLDPNNTNALTQNGYFQPIPSGYAISGNVKTYYDSAFANVKVFLSGPALDTAITDLLGNYLFTNVPAGGPYTISPSRDTNDINGVSTVDLALLSKHILNVQSLDSPWKIIAADANRSNSVTTFDLVESRKIILGINNVYPLSSSWRFFPAFISFSNPANPFATSLPEVITIPNLQADYPNANFKGVKVGDLNQSADPNN